MLLPSAQMLLLQILAWLAPSVPLGLCLNVTFTARPFLASWELPLPSYSSFFSIALIMGVCRFYLCSLVSSSATGCRDCFLFCSLLCPSVWAGAGHSVDAQTLHR